MSNIIWHFISDKASHLVGSAVQSVIGIWCRDSLTYSKVDQELLKCSWTVKSEQKLQSCLKFKKSQNPFCHILEILNKNYQKIIGGSIDALTIYGAPKLCTVM